MSLFYFICCSWRSTLHSTDLFLWNVSFAWLISYNKEHKHTTIMILVQVYQIKFKNVNPFRGFLTAAYVTFSSSSKEAADILGYFFLSGCHRCQNCVCFSLVSCSVSSASILVSLSLHMSGGRRGTGNPAFRHGEGNEGQASLARIP